jgi:hypothetical protein
MIDVETDVVNYQKTTRKTNVVIDIKFNVSISTFGNKKRLTTTKQTTRSSNLKRQNTEKRK